MRKVKLQMQLSLDGFVAGPKGEMDWMVWNWDDELKNYVNELTEPVDCILLGRALAQDFIPAWASRISNPETADAFAHKMVNSPKVVFSKTLKTIALGNTKLAHRNLTDEIIQLKNQPGKDIIVYGGANFVSNLVKQGLIDEYHFFINPVVLGNGMTIFKELNERLQLGLVKATTFACGIVVLFYQPV
jgi:dihydrofolate reductase